KLPTRKSLTGWRESTPKDFCFAVKGSRFLTHMKKLKNAQEGLGRFLDAVSVLGPKLGPILFQLPPKWEIDLDRLGEFLSLLPRSQRCAFEFRNATWNTAATYRLMKEHN